MQNPTRTFAEVDLNVISRNLLLLNSLARKSYSEFLGSIVMVKADAYGHGLVPVSKKLATAADCLGFGVASLTEASQLRQNKVSKDIFVFSESTPLNSESIQLILRQRLIPVLHTLEDLRKFLGVNPKALFHLKFNTGMNRLGLPMSEAGQVYQLLRKYRAIPQGLMTHLAVSEQANHSLTRRQVEAFESLVGCFSGFGASYIHCANTAGLLGDKKLGLGKFCNVARPGLGLYGYVVDGQTNSNRSVNLKPALKWKAKVGLSRLLEPNDRVGYGSTYRAKMKQTQAIVEVGYGDGFKRQLSNQKILLASGTKTKPSWAQVQGRVSMDLCSISIKAKPGTWVTLLGEGDLQGHQMAESAQTIVYEILTSLSNRVPRIYSGL